MSNVKFDNLNGLYLLIPLFLLITIPFVITIRKRKIKFHQIGSFILHLLICVLATLSLSGLKTEEIRKETMIYFVADVSASSETILNQMDAYIEEFTNQLSKSSQMGIVAFAKDAQELVGPNEKVKSLSEATVDKSATNIENALCYTLSLFPENLKKRIVLLSDGKQTDGDALLCVEQLDNENVRIDAVYFNSDLLEDEIEVQIDEVTYNPSTFKGNEDGFVVKVKSNRETSLRIELFDNLQSMYSNDVVVQPGNNEILLPANTQDVGLHQYKVQIYPDQDEKVENNHFYFSQEIHDKCEILIISSSFSDANFIASLMQEDANVTKYITYNTIPSNIESYMKYDEIILSNVKLSVINNAQTLVSTLETLVANYGKSLLTFGGTSTYFDGGFYSSKLKDMLPVDINPEDTKQRTALILLIDNSGSMSGSRLDMAKTGAIACLDILSEKDYVGIITFEDDTRVIQPITSVKFKDSIIEKINYIPEGNGTMMTPGLQEAYEEMKKMEGIMSNREIILISDGMPADGGQEEVVEQMAADGIVLSTINIGGAYSELLLATLAQVGNGRNYTISSSDKLPTILLNEVKQIVMETTIEENIAIHIAKPNDQLVQNIQTLPMIYGYNFSKAKYNTTTVLDTTLNLENGGSIEHVPIYTYWNYGQGKVSSFMSDISGSWAMNLFNSAIGQQLFHQLIMSNYPSVKIDSYLQFEVSTQGYTSKLEVSVPKMITNTELEATITSPSGKKENLKMNINNGKYVQICQTLEEGTYHVLLTYKNNKTGDVYLSENNFSFSYSLEYNRFLSSDNILLCQLTNNRGVVSNHVEEIVNIEQEDVIFSQYYSFQLLMLALILFVIDVAIRKLRWKDLTNLFKKIG